jgi:L-iditol 2-dehydrogenase
MLAWNSQPYDRSTMSNTKTHIAALLHGAKDLRISRIPTPELLPHEVLIAPRATGICGTDMHYYSAGRNGMFKVTTPLVLGHEAAGVIMELGPAVESLGLSLKVGDRVAIEPQRPCEKCEICRSGKYNLCRKLKFSGSASANPPVQGSLQGRYAHPASWVYPLPDSMNWEEAAMIEPLSVAVHAVRRSQIRAGMNVVILGAGAIGLFCAAVARVQGARWIGMIDVDSSRLDFAVRHGFAQEVSEIPMHGQEGETKPDMAKRLASDLSNKWALADVVFDCTGVETCVNIGIHMAAPGGKVVLVGMGQPVQNINVGAAAVREVDLLSLWRYSNTFQAAIALISSGQLDVKPLITHKYDLERAEEALKLVVDKPKDLIKCVITSSH